jgi:hypothetical protein
MFTKIHHPFTRYEIWSLYIEYHSKIVNKKGHRKQISVQETHMEALEGRCDLFTLTRLSGSFLRDVASSLCLSGSCVYKYKQLITTLSSVAPTYNIQSHKTD